MRDEGLKKSVLLFAVAAVIALFARTAAFSFIGLDDAAYTFRNPFVAGGLSGPNIAEAFANLRHGGIWMPFTYVTYMADVSFCRAVGIPLVFWMHLSNVVLHAVNVLVLCRLLHALTSEDAVDESALIIAALLWAVHPLRAEPVAWIAGRKELLWSLFALLGLRSWCRSLWAGDSPQRGFRLLAYGFCFLSCLSKPTAMCFPALALLIECHVRREFRFWTFERWLMRYLPLLAIAGVTATIAAYSQTHVAGLSEASLYEGTFAHRLVNALSALGFYVKATFWPIGLHIDCRAVNAFWPLGATWNILVLVLFAVGVAMIWPRLKHRPTQAKTPFDPGQIILALGWFLLAVFPTLGVLGSFGFEAHADRFAYLPTMAFSFLAVRALSGRWKSAGLALVVVLAVVTFRQLGFWRDDAVAHAHALACDPGHPRAMLHVADARCARQHDFDGGIVLYRKALGLAHAVPLGGFDVADAKARLAYALASRGRAADFDEILILGADVLNDVRLDRRGMMLDALGTAMMRHGDRGKAAALFQASLDAPARFWPKDSTKRKLAECREGGL